MSSSPTAGCPPTCHRCPPRCATSKWAASWQNLAISALAVRPLDGRPQLFAAVTNYGARDADTILSLTVDGALQAADRLSVPAGQTTSLNVSDLPATAHLIRADLTQPAANPVPDYLALDNTAYAVYSPPTGGRVLLISSGNLFLDQVLAALPNVKAFRALPPDNGQMPEGNYDLVILDGWLPDQLPQANLLIINPPSSTALFSVGDTFTTTRFVDQAADDPILSFVNFKDVAVREARLVQSTGWARALVSAEGGPLLLAGTAGTRRVAILTFDLLASDLPLRIDFPILVANLFDWFSPARAFDASDGLQPGQSLLIRPQPTTTEYRITLPDGTHQSYPAGPDPLNFAATNELGIYTVELVSGGTVTTTDSFAVNLFAPAESRIAPADAIAVGQTTVSTTQPTNSYGQRELWPWLALVALLVLGLEWWVYQRGSVIGGRERAERDQKPRRRLLYFGRRQ